VVAGGSAAQCGALAAYGLKLGLAFQLADDALDYGGASETLGKNAGDDFREGKVTLPLLLAIKRSGPAETAFWRRAVGEREQSEADFRRALELIGATGALADTRALAQTYADEAKRELRIFPGSDWRESLEALSDFAVERAA
jgi:octaprenyl-diphosphate synthase